jgi:hypothetical protein
MESGQPWHAQGSRKWVFIHLTADLHMEVTTRGFRIADFHPPHCDLTIIISSEHSYAGRCCSG